MNVNIEYKYDYRKHYELKLPKDIWKNGKTGLINHGQICYFNSILQCLSHTLKLTDHLLSDQYSEKVRQQRESTKRTFFTNYILLMLKIWDVNTTTTSKYLLKCFDYMTGTNHNLNIQRDSHEIFLKLLDILNDCLSYPVKIKIKGNIRTETDILYKKAYDAWVSYLDDKTSIIIKLFSGLTVKIITCKKCSYKSYKFTPFNSISLSLDNEYDNLLDILKHNFKNETVKDWKCEKCNKKGCTIESWIWEMPKYINFHFMRAIYEQKNTKDIIYPHVDFKLNDIICPYKNDKNNYIYDLYSVNYHVGNDSDSGHYFSICKDLQNEWYIFNDANVSKLELENPPYSDSYILFYYRKFIK